MRGIELQPESVRHDSHVRQRATAVQATLAVFLALAPFVASTAAGPFSELVVFGDSLSDIGNVQQATEELAIFGVDPIPGPYYYNGRFSNGPVYIESLAAGMGLPLVHSRSGGSDYAHGGAKTTGTTGLPSFVVQDIDDQVSDFLPSAPADPDALFVVFAGANDVLDLNITNLSTAANQLRTDIDRLVTAGARQFLVFNQPLMGETPRFNANPANRTAYNSRSTQFNNALASSLDSLAASNPALTIFRFDVASLFTQAIASPQTFGLTNVTQAAAPGLEPGAPSYNTSQIAPNANEYLFWDDLHPTTTVHAVLAQRAMAVVARGDFNWDGVVDAADYVIWRKEFSFVDFGQWTSNFGDISGGGGVLLASHFSVPEPASAVLFLMAAVAICFSRRKNATHRD